MTLAITKIVLLEIQQGEKKNTISLYDRFVTNKTTYAVVQIQIQTGY